MKKTYLFAAILTLMASLFSACHIEKIKGDGNIKEVVFPIRSYDKITIGGDNIDLTYTQSNKAPYLKIETDQNIFDNLEVEVDGHELIIGPKKYHTFISPTRFIITTNSSALEGFKMAGSGDANLGEGLKGDKFVINLAGGGCITADSIAYDNLNCKIAGNGTLCLSGTADKLDLKSAGDCKVEAFGLTTNIFKSKSAGNSTVEITVNQKIDVSMIGNGEIKYKGNPPYSNRKVIGNSSLIHIEDSI